MVDLMHDADVVDVVSDLNDFSFLSVIQEEIEVEHYQMTLAETYFFLTQIHLFKI